MDEKIGLNISSTSSYGSLKIGKKRGLMTSDQILKIVEQYSHKNEDGYGDIKVTRIQDRKTMFVENIDEVGRTVMMNEFKVDGATYWAGFSTRSQTVYISQAA
jgi:hypothetical protein